MRAKITWRKAEEGGRSKPPLGEGSPPYATMVRFEDFNDIWSLVVEKLEEIDTHTWFANVRFLVSGAPSERLKPGKAFELYEGKKCVASGVIC